MKEGGGYQPRKTRNTQKKCRKIMVLFSCNSCIERQTGLTQRHNVAYRNQNDGIRPDACQWMKNANEFLMEYFTSVGTFHPLAKRTYDAHADICCQKCTIL
jgi:hypothetical protein